MSGDVSIDVGNAVPYLVECIKSWFGKDKLTAEAKARFERLFRLSIGIDSHVQCIGMWNPIPIGDIYQPTRLTQYYSESHGYAKIITTIFELIENKKNAIILAGPGDGKTTLMHWTYIQLLNKINYLPILITLRWPDSIREFEALILDLQDGKTPSKKKATLILLVDGYDEINPDERKKVSKLLAEFSAFDFGNFYLTCRTHYEIYDIKEGFYWIDKFNNDDSLGFCTSFMKIYGGDTNPSVLLSETHRRGLQSFIEHPLMLALVCLLQSIPVQGLPRSPLGLIRRAIDTLTFRWDESKGLSRSSTIPLDGEERVRCLMKIAYEMKELISPNQTVYEAAKDHLIHQQIEGVDTRKFLIELAQWYGLLIPVSPYEWGFVHRTIHDFLAARYWVECGGFASDRIHYISTRWDTRTAYAMSILPNATNFLKKALNQNCEMHILSHCLMNNAIFDPNIIADSIFNYFHRNVTITVGNSIYSGNIKVEINQELDFFRDASIPFLDAILLRAIKDRGDVKISGILLSYALFEFLNRNIKIKESIIRQIIEYLRSPKFHFNILKGNEYITFLLDSIPQEI